MHVVGGLDMQQCGLKNSLKNSLKSSLHSTAITLFIGPGIPHEKAHNIKGGVVLLNCKHLVHH